MNGEKHDFSPELHSQPAWHRPVLTVVPAAGTAFEDGSFFDGSEPS